MSTRKIIRKGSLPATNKIMDLNSATVTLGMQTSELADRTHDSILELRKLLAHYCQGPYSPEISEFSLILRVGGKFREFDFEGCDRLRRNRKQKYITADLGVPTHRWRDVSDAAFRTYLIETVETGLLCCVRSLERDKTPIDSGKLMEDFSKVKQLFLASRLIR
jgi:hypothetical protein